MRALVLSDIHGNLEALTAVLAAAGEYDQLWHLGDIVGYGGSPNQVIDVIEPIASLNVRGNHDRVCCGQASALGFNPVARAAALWTLKELTPAHIAWLSAMPQGPIAPHQNGTASVTGQVAAPGETLNVTCVHGSPLNEDQYILSMRDAWAPLQRMESGVTLFGHTHVQGNFSLLTSDWEEERPRYDDREYAVSERIELTKGTRHLINPGSVGQPRDNDWRAAFAIYEHDADDRVSVTFHRIPYDVAAAQTAIREAGLPERLATRLSAGR